MFIEEDAHLRYKYTSFPHYVDLYMYSIWSDIAMQVSFYFKHLLPHLNKRLPLLEIIHFPLSLPVPLK